MNEIPDKPKKPRRARSRANGEGSVYKRASDGLWVGTAYLPDGKRKPVYGKTRGEVVVKKRDLETEIEQGLPITSGRGITLGQYLDGQWLAVTLPQRVVAGRLAESTLDSYRLNVEKHIIPALGGERLSKLTANQIRKWMTELQAKPSGKTRRKLRDGESELPPPTTLSARTVVYVYAILRKALNDAVRDEIVKRNVVLLVEPPVSKRPEIKPPTKEETRQLLTQASGDRLWVHWLIVLALGLRRGEGLGLHWADLDLDAGTVSLQTSVQRVRGEKNGETGRRTGRLVQKRLKTDASHATIALPKYVTAALQEHRKAQNAERLAARLWENNDLVFTTSIGTALEPRNVNREWDRVCERAGVRRVRIHDLRHAAATYLFADGVDLKIVQATLRHTRLATTADLYTHVFPEVQRTAAESMDGVLKDLSQPAKKQRQKRAS